MTQHLFYKDKKIGILGLGVTGTACYNYLLHKASRILCFDDNESNLNKFASIHGSNNINSFHENLERDGNLWMELDFIILSPGIPIKYPQPHPIVAFAAQNNIKIISDIDLLYLENVGKKFIGITGTNGKSTISSLIYHIIKNCGLNYALCGNIGIAPLSLDGEYDGYIIELSSFQLELIGYLKLDIAIISNITEDHLDRYEDFASYIKSKIKIFDICHGEKIISTDSEIIKKLDLSIFDKLYKISKEGIGYLIDDPSGRINYVEDKGLTNKILMTNYLYAHVTSSLIGIEDKDILKSALSFKPLKHRMEFVGTYNNIDFYNDSKATNVAAAITSISSLANIFWLAGGISKGGDYSPIEKYLQNIKKAYLFGQSKYEIADFFKTKIDFIICEDMVSAFKLSVKDAFLEKHANILLAPCCSSFDQFKNFEDRGSQFIEMFHKIK